MIARDATREGRSGRRASRLGLALVVLMVGLPSIASPAGADGTEWLTVNVPLMQWSDVATDGNGVWVAVASFGTDRVMRSTDDGANWTTAGITGFLSTSTWRSIAYGNGVWVAVASSHSGAAVRVMRSTDGGLSWAEPSDMPWHYRTWTSIATDGDGVWVAVAQSAREILRSEDDGLTWAFLDPSGSATSRWQSVATDGDGVWVAVADNLGFEVMRSTDDGTTWNAVTKPAAITTSDERFMAVAYGNGDWIAVGLAGTVRAIRSSDGGATWAPVTVASEQWRSVAFGDGAWIAVTDQGTHQVMRSTDAGVTWTTDGITGASGVATWQSVAFGQGVWLAVAAGGTDRVMRSGSIGINAGPPPSGTFDLGVASSSPTIDGGAALQVGATLRAPEVTWTGDPTAFRWNWQSCTDTQNVPGSCLETSTTDETLTLTEDLVGRRVRVQPIASNAGGETVLSSSFTSGSVSPTPSLATAADLSSALCTGSGAVSLPDNVPDATETLAIADDCTATLDLNGVTLAVRNVVLGAGSTLTIRDTNDATSGFLRAEGAVFGVAGIRTAGATLRVESGVVVANGGATAAGIGGDGLADRDGGTVEITEGIVEARGGMSAAGIGGGFTGAGGTVTISGGTVDVFAGLGGAAIGGGSDGAGGTITITGGAVIAEGTGLDPIGPGSGGAPGTVTIGSGGSRCDDGLFAIIAFDGSGASCATQDPGTGLDPGTDEDDGSGPVEDARVDGSPAPASVRNGPLVCAPAVVRPGASVECTITGGTPGSQLAWRAAFNPTFAGDIVTLDSTGAGSFRFTVPAGAADRPIMVELVELEATVVLASEDGPVPTSVPAGQGPPVVPTWLVSLTSISLAIALLLATRVLAPGGRGARPQRSALRG